jgi:tetratricopeptide (TPR) repeat protein
MKASREKQRLKPLGAVDFFQAGSVHMQMKEYGEAIRCFQKFLAIVPGSHEALGKIGTCYLAQGFLDRAREKYSEALRISPEYAPARLGLEKIRGLPRKGVPFQGGEGAEG